MIDLSALRKFEITGPDAEAFMQYALTRNIRRLAVGEIAYSASCLETGGMVDDGTIFRMGENCFRWICGDEYSGTWLKQLAQQHGYKVSIRNSSQHIHNIAVQGPHSRALLQQLIWTPEHQPSVEKLAWFHFTLGKLGGTDGIPVMVSRTGYTGELGFEVWCHPSHAEQLWDAVWQEGQQYEIAPLGFDALDLLRIEAGLIFAQHEFSAETNPYEAGIGFTVPMKTKEEDFIGKQAMKNQAPESRHKLMGLVLEGNEAVQHGDLVYVGRFPVGVVTSAANSPVLQQQIALCRLARSMP
jgi:aminomethyltransferase